MTLETQLFVHYAEPYDFSIKPVINGYTCKPQSGGMWTSTYKNNGNSGWTEFLLSNRIETHDLNELSWFLVYPKSEARILVINSISDAITLYKRYGIKNSDFPTKKNMMAIDFVSIEEEYDGINLTHKCQLETSDRSVFPNFYGWDCESTLWFRWKFDLCKKIKEPEKRIKSK